ncbi:MAG: urease accessory protein UreD [Rhodococcus sp. (in: high G+C Gram-positive bacteria)]
MQSTVTIVASTARSPRIEAVGALAVRRTGPDRVHLIGSAATPLGGDVIDVRIVVEAGATLDIRTVAASVALPGRSTNISHASWTVEVEDGGVLTFDPEPTIVAGSADHRTATTLAVGANARVVLRERVQLGRSGEVSGRWAGSVNVDGPDGPVLRHRLELGSGADGHDILFAPMASASTFTWPDATTDGVEGGVDQGLWAAMPVAGGGMFSTWLGHRLASCQPARLASAPTPDVASS